MSGCANGGFGGNGGFALGSSIERLEYMPRPEIGYNSGNIFTSTAVLQGGSFTLPRKVRVNRIIVRTAAFTAPATAVVLIYQEARGLLTDSLSLVASIGYTPILNTNHEIALNEGIVILSEGFFYALWGQDTGGGSYAMGTFNGAAGNLYNSNVPTGLHPVSASSAIGPAAPVDPLDPLIGGDLTAAGSNDVVPIIRFRNV